MRTLAICLSRETRPNCWSLFWINSSLGNAGSCYEKSNQPMVCSKLNETAQMNAHADISKSRILTAGQKFAIRESCKTDNCIHPIVVRIVLTVNEGNSSDLRNSTENSNLWAMTFGNKSIVCMKLYKQYTIERKQFRSSLHWVMIGMVLPIISPKDD